MAQAIEWVAVAPQGFESIVREELGSRLIEARERLHLARGPCESFFAQNIWKNPKTATFKSIREASDLLRSIQRSWWLHPTGHHRRAALIQAQLPPVKAKDYKFLQALPTQPLGSWTLLDENRLLYASECSSGLPDGEIYFQEDKVGPPARAYLKLWELFTVYGIHPSRDERVVDLGSAPGSWTWVLDQLGCQVVSVDKAELAPSLTNSPRIQHLTQSAFALEPKDVGEVSWLFSDIICYPERLLALVKKWEPIVPNLVCTIKFQGATDFEIIRKFLEIPGSRVAHLTHNKHELTWWRI